MKKRTRANKNPKVSIITTYRIGRGDINGLVRSLKKQTFKDFEFIPHLDTHNQTFSEGFNWAINKSRGEFIIITEADCVWNSPYLLDLVMKSMKKGRVVMLKDAGSELVGFHRSDSIPFDEDLFVAEDTKWVSDMKKKGIEFYHVFEHQRQLSVVNIYRAFVYPFEYFYPGTVMTPTHLLVRDIFYIIQNIAEIIMIPPAILFSFVKRMRNR